MRRKEPTMIKDLSNLDLNEIKNVKYVINPCVNNMEWCEYTSEFISKLWNEPRMMFNINKFHNLGDTQFVHVRDDVIVVNSIIFVEENNELTFSEGAFRYALSKINDEAFKYDGTIHIYKNIIPFQNINWMTMYDIIKQTMCVNVYIHTDTYNVRTE